MIRKTFIFFCILLIITGAGLCAQSPERERAQTAAYDALRMLDELLYGTARNTSAEPEKSPVEDANTLLETGTDSSIQNTAEIHETRGGQEPLWVQNPYSVYPRDIYFAAVGFAPNRRAAEQNAFAALVEIFGMEVISGYHASSAYTETITNQSISFTEDTVILEAIYTAARLDSLIGAQIGYVWDDSRGNVYALAYMNKEKAVAVYTQLIRLNQFNIDSLTGMTAAEKNTFDGYNRYKLAAVLAGLNEKYAVIIVQAGGLTSNLYMTNSDSLWLEAENIKQNITFSIDVKGSLDNRVYNAFATVVTAEGFRVQKDNAPYTLRVTLDLNQDVFPNNRNVFCRYIVSAVLVENAGGSELTAYTSDLNNREGGSNYEQAQVFAVNKAVSLIGEEYSAVFREFLLGAMD